MPLVLAAISALVISACSSSDESQETTIDDLDVTVTGSGAERSAEITWGGEPIADTEEPFTATASETRIISGEGAGGAAPADTGDATDEPTDPAGDTGDATDGPTEEPDAGPDRASIEYVLVNGTSGETVVSTFESGPVTVDVSAGSLLPPGLLRALDGAEPGTSMLTVLTPNDGFGPNGSPEFGISGTDTVIMYVEVVDLFDILDAAEGTPVDPVDGLPTVEADGVNAATVTIPEGEEPPAELIVQPLIEGEGPVTEAGDTVTVHYTGVSWDTGETFDDSWSRGAPFPVEDLGNAPLIQGWNDGLVGLPVGSRVMLVIPPELAYGEAPEEGAEQATDAPQQSPLAGQTLVFVIDILDAS